MNRSAKPWTLTRLTILSFLTSSASVSNLISTVKIQIFKNTNSPKDRNIEFLIIRWIFWKIIQNHLKKLIFWCFFAFFASPERFFWNPQIKNVQCSKTWMKNENVWTVWSFLKWNASHDNENDWNSSWASLTMMSYEQFWSGVEKRMTKCVLNRIEVASLIVSEYRGVTLSQRIYERGGRSSNSVFWGAARTSGKSICLGLGTST